MRQYHRTGLGAWAIAPTLAAIVLAGAIAVVRPGRTPATSASGPPCPAVASPTFIPISGAPLSEIRIDDSCTHVYASNPTLGEIEVYNLQTHTLESPIAVGSAPMGFDITPDGTTMYVANSGATNISVVNLATRYEVRRITAPPPSFLNDRPLSIAIANNGKAFFSTTFAGSGFGARMMQLDLSSDTVTQRTDFFINGTTTEATFLKASPDRSAIGVVVGDISSGPVFTYRSATDTFSPEVDGGGGGYRGYIASDTSGSTFLVGGYPAAEVRNRNLGLLGTIPLGAQLRSFGVAVKPDGTTGYRAVAGGVEILDLVSFGAVGVLAVGDTLGSPHPASYPARMAISSDGSLLAVNTDHGFALLAAATTPAPTPTPTDTATPTATATPSPTPTPAVAAGVPRALRGLSGTVSFGRDFADGGSVRFARRMGSSNYVVMLTPVNRTCAPMLTARTDAGFSFSCPGAGGAVDWLVIESSQQNGDQQRRTNQ